MEAIEFVHIQALARSARTSRVPPIRHNSLWLGPAGAGHLFRLAACGALDLRASSACGKRSLKFLLGRAQREGALVSQQNQTNTNKKHVRAS